VCTTIYQQGGTKPTTTRRLGISHECATWMGQIPTTPHQFQSKEEEEEEEEEDQSVVLLLIYQSFGMSPVRVKLTCRIIRFIFP
jgi:hypothetical protein